MKRERVYTDYLSDILTYAEKAEIFTANINLETFQSNEEKVFAVIRALEVIGEAAKHIPTSVRRHYPQIPWKKIVGMRNVVIHGYFGVDTEVIWRTVQDDLPPLRRIVDRILKEKE